MLMQDQRQQLLLIYRLSRKKQSYLLQLLLNSIENKHKDSYLEKINEIDLKQLHTEELNKPNKTFDGNLKPFLEKIDEIINELTGDSGSKITIDIINKQITAEKIKYIADLLTIIKAIWNNELNDTNFILQSYINKLYAFQ